MPVIAVFGAKGGVGASLVAVNLGRHLVERDPTLLVDLVPMTGCCDLLLDVSFERSWAELLPVADELSKRHLELSVVRHSSGLALLAAPQNCDTNPNRTGALLGELATRWPWLVLDGGSGCTPYRSPVFSVADLAVLVTTPDPPALRAANRWRDRTQAELKQARWGLVINQLSSDHPAHPERTAASLETELLGVLPPDRETVAQQIHFGRHPSRAGGSKFTTAMERLTERLLARVSETVSEPERPTGVIDNA